MYPGLELPVLLRGFMRATRRLRVRSRPLPELARTFGVAAAVADGGPDALAEDGGPDTLAARLLQAAMGGDDLVRASQFFTVEMDGPCMDDTTLVTLRL
jgi:hypothetical protein